MATSYSTTDSTEPTSKMFGDQTGGSADHPGLVDPSNLGLDLGSTLGDTTTPEMTVGGTADVPIADAGIQIAAPDLTAAELRGGAKAADNKKRMYNVVEVIGSVMPSENAKYTGPTPSMALNKAARRIHKKNPGAPEFSVLMRRVSPKHTERELYRYDVKMVKGQLQGFLTVVVDKFTSTAGDAQKNVDKKVRVVQQSEHPLFGYINHVGVGVADARAVDQQFKLVRSPGTNTLYLVVPGALPDKVNGLAVNKTEWYVTSERNTDIGAEHREKYDTAAHTRDRETAVLQKKKEREQKKKEVERARAKAAKEKEQAAELKARARERAAAKKERDAQIKQDKKQREAAKKEALKVKASLLKDKAKAKASKASASKAPASKASASKASAPKAPAPE
jgi:chemotaxis protein histidine kinase CheA